jgi:hypothetical protein
MPGMVDSALDTQQTVQINPVGVGFSILSPYAVFPRCSESGPFDSAQKVDAVGGDTQLENLFSRVRIQEMWTAEFSEREVRPFDILFTGINPYVHVLGIAGFRVIDECEAANYQVSDTVLMQEIKKVFEILDGLHRP